MPHFVQLGDSHPFSFFSRRVGTQLASGSADGDIVVWDVIGEAGIYRLKGHKGAITGLQFAPKHSLLLSSSRDTYVKVWDVDTRHCLQTIVGHRCEVTSLVALDADAERFVTGSADIELRIFKLVDTAGEADATSKVRYDQIGSIARQSRVRNIACWFTFCCIIVLIVSCVVLFFVY